MDIELVIFAEKRSEHIQEFLDAISSKMFISFGELRKMFPNTTTHDTIKTFIYKINTSINTIYPKIKIFGLDIILDENKKISRCYKINQDIIFKTTKYHYVILLKNENQDNKNAV